MKKVLINNCYGGFGFSNEFISHIKTLGINVIERDTPEVVEEAIKFGLDKASGCYSELIVEEIPDGAYYCIDEYDGLESISELFITVSYENLKNGLSEEQLNLVRSGCSIHLKSE